MDVLELIRAWIPVLAVVATAILGILVMRLRSEISASLRPVDSEINGMKVRLALIEQAIEGMPSDADIAEINGKITKVSTEISHNSELLKSMQASVEFTNRLLLEGKRP